MGRLDTALRYYRGMSEAARLRESNGIELNRKGDAVITVAVPDGETMPAEITLEVEQKNHEFRFGANIFMLDEIETPEKMLLTARNLRICSILQPFRFTGTLLTPSGASRALT